MPECCGRTCEPPACYRDSPRLQTCCGWICNNALLVFTVVGIVLGYGLGAILRVHNLNNTALVLIGFPGELFLRMLQLLVLPLIISSLVTGSTSLDPKINGRVALVTVSYFLLTSLVSAIIGIILVLAIHPGDPDIKDYLEPDAEHHAVSMLDTFLDLIRNALPENVVQACINQVETKYKWDTIRLLPGKTTEAPFMNGTDTVNAVWSTIQTTLGENSTSEPMFSDNEVLPEFLRRVRKPVLVYRKQMNGLGLIVFFMAFGMVLSNMKEKAVVLVEYFVVLDKIVMKLVKGVIKFTPIGVCSLICAKMAAEPNLPHIVEHMGLYIATVIIGLVIHQFIFLPVLYLIITRKNPLRFWWNVFQAFLTGFATESSAAALPITIQCMEEKNEADPRITRFVLPVGATINMNGTAMFVAIASVFIAQMNNIEVSTTEVISVIFTATAVSVASSATPSASLFLMVMTLSVLPNTPLSDVSLLFAIDWFLGRCRTTNNILGDCYAVAVMQHFYGKQLDEHTSELEKNRKDHMVPGIGLMYD